MCACELVRFSRRAHVTIQKQWRSWSRTRLRWQRPRPGRRSRPPLLDYEPERLGPSDSGVRWISGFSRGLRQGLARLRGWQADEILPTDYAFRGVRLAQGRTSSSCATSRHRSIRSLADHHFDGGLAPDRHLAWLPPFAIPDHLARGELTRPAHPTGRQLIEPRKIGATILLR